MEKKIGFERKIKREDGNIVIGGLNRKNNKCFYLRLESWVTPIDMTIEKSADLIRRSLISHIPRMSYIYYDQNATHLIDVNYPLTKFRNKGKISCFVFVELTVFVKQPIEVNEDFYFINENYCDSLFTLLKQLPIEMNNKKVK